MFNLTDAWVSVFSLQCLSSFQLNSLSLYWSRSQKCYSSAPLILKFARGLLNTICTHTDTLCTDSLQATPGSYLLSISRFHTVSEFQAPCTDETAHRRKHTAAYCLTLKQRAAVCLTQWRRDRQCLLFSYTLKGKTFHVSIVICVCVNIQLTCWLHMITVLLLSGE